VAIPISSINNVTAYGPVNPILPIIAGAGCGYLGTVGGFVVGCLMFPPEELHTSTKSDEKKWNTASYLGGAISAVSGYITVHRFMASRSQNIVAMESWTFEKKRNFLFSELKP